MCGVVRSNGCSIFWQSAETFGWRMRNVRPNPVQESLCSLKGVWKYHTHTHILCHALITNIQNSSLFMNSFWEILSCLLGGESPFSGHCYAPGVRRTQISHKNVKMDITLHYRSISTSYSAYLEDEHFEILPLQQLMLVGFQLLNLPRLLLQFGSYALHVDVHLADLLQELGDRA